MSNDSEQVQNQILYPVAPADLLNERITYVQSELSGGVNPEELVITTDPYFSFSPELESVGGVGVRNAQLIALRDRILASWRESIGHNLNPSSTDSKMASVLYDELRIHPAQVENELMWGTLATYVLPDYVVGRFSDAAKGYRFGADRRNALSRLWFRRHAITEDMEREFSDILDQDFIQQIVERPSLSSDQRLTRKLLEISREYRSVDNQRKFYRELIKEITLLSSVSMPQLMSDKVLDRELRKRADRIETRLAK